MKVNWEIAFEISLAVCITLLSSRRLCTFLGSCLHHPGFPFFHDAYKSWTCCNKKSVDFTEFLNIKGCTLSKHSNEKPLQPEKPKKVSEEETEDKIITGIRPSMQMLALNRPPLDSSLKTIEPIVAEAVKKQFDSLPKFVAESNESKSGFVTPGTICKNGGCNFEYIDYCSNDNECIHHPGVPIFHEGMKYWSCCQKKTSDFTAFMNQLGCTTGKHKWLNEDEEAKIVKCRWDWHQTAANVIISIYAKLYDYQTSRIQVNPIRLICNLKFPQQGDSEFNIDLELRGVSTISFIPFVYI